jgi:hypothetical protein
MATAWSIFLKTGNLPHFCEKLYVAIHWHVGLWALALFRSGNGSLQLSRVALPNPLCNLADLEKNPSDIKDNLATEYCGCALLIHFKPPERYCHVPSSAVGYCPFTPEPLACILDFIRLYADIKHWIITR